MTKIEISKGNGVSILFLLLLILCSFFPLFYLERSGINEHVLGADREVLGWRAFCSHGN